MGDANAELSRTDLSHGIGTLLAIRLRSTIIAPSLPHAANGRFNAMISWGPAMGIRPFGAFRPAVSRQWELTTLS